ncbi:MAG: hypothetical protein MUC28_00550 [Planctomycetes bacterium]|jgi:hypothetical protein|nr:hypothetical protein [Planctomycetota bacterium]
MNSSTKLIIGLAIILGNAVRKYLGFYPVISLAGFGYNIINIGLYVFGFYLIDSAFRTKQKAGNTARTAPAGKSGVTADKNNRLKSSPKTITSNSPVYRMKIKIIIISIAGSLLAAPSVLAHQPRLVGETEAVEITDPETSQAFYGELKGRPQIFEIKSETPFSLYLGLLVPDRTDSKKDFMAIAAKAGGEEIDNIITLDGRTALWPRYFEPFSGNHYLKGPEKKVEAAAGFYSIIVGNGLNEGKYVLAVGEKEEYPLDEIANTLKLLPSIKTDFFQQPLYAAFVNLTGAFILAVFLAATVMLAGIYRLARGRWPRVFLTLVFLASLAGGSLIAASVIPALKVNTAETETAAEKAELIGFSAVKPNLTATGRELEKIEIWAVPSGTDVTPDNYQMLGTAILAETTAGEQTWQFPIPAEPILASEIFAQGYDRAGLAIGQVSLPFTGTAEIYNELWGSGSAGTSVVQVADSGRTFAFGLSSRFSLALDSAVYPASQSVCEPSGVVQPVPGAIESTPPLDTVIFEAIGVGACELKNNDFSVRIKVYDPAAALVKNTNQGYAFSLQYPPEDIFSTQPDHALATLNPIVRIDLPANYFSGTNLNEAGVIISASGSPAILDVCLESAAGENMTGTTTINGMNFLIFQSEEAAAGNRHETISYRVVYNGLCYEAAITFRSGAMENYPPGAVAEFDRELILNKLKPVVESLVFIR